MADLRADRAGDGRSLWRRWVLANSVGFAVGGAISGAIARAMGQPHYGVATSTTDAVLIATRTAGGALAVWGAAVGASQWLVIRRELRRVGWWVPATTLGWTSAGVVAGIFSGLIGGAVTGIGPDVGVWGFVVATAVGILALGLLPVTFQWMMLRGQVHGAGRWLVGAAGAFLVAAVVSAGVVRSGLVSVIGWLRPEDFPSAKAWVAFGAVVGVLYGTLTGATLGKPLGESSLAAPPESSS
ncbi:MAG: hypothetical protein ACRDHI_01460 [Actinomycetota bacterium]